MDYGSISLLILQHIAQCIQYIAGINLENMVLFLRWDAFNFASHHLVPLFSFNGYLSFLIEPTMTVDETNSFWTDFDVGQ